jgi:hypothetical protein
MSPHLLVWIAALIMQSALLGRSMFAVSPARTVAGREDPRARCSLGPGPSRPLPKHLAPLPRAPRAPASRGAARAAPSCTLAAAAPRCPAPGAPAPATSGPPRMPRPRRATATRSCP